MTNYSRNNATELETLEKQVRRSRKLVQQFELKVEAIEASIHEIEKFHPKIKIIQSPSSPEATTENGFSLFAEHAFIKG